MIARHAALWALTASLLTAQTLESFTRLARPGETFFGGEWSSQAEQPSARFAQGDGAFEIKGSTNDSRNFVDIYHASDGAHFSIGANRFLEISARMLPANRAPHVRVALIDAAGRSASATFAATDFAGNAFRSAIEPLAFANGFNPAAIERMRVSGDVIGGAAEFAFAFNEIAAVPRGGMIEGGLRNFSTRSQMGAGANVPILGFVTNGSAPKPVLVRALGPALATFGIAGVAADPHLQVFRGSATVATNDNWSTDATAGAAFGRAGAFPLSAGSRDAAAGVTLMPGVYTAQASGGAGASGIAMLELYDLDETPAYPNQRFTNVAARGSVGAGAAQLTTGFVIDGRVPKRVLVRVAGPALASVGLAAGFAADPQLRLVRVIDGVEQLVRENNDWETGNDRALLADLAAKAGAFPFAAGSRDAAIVATLAPGTYLATAMATGTAGGVALVEIYDLP